MQTYRVRYERMATQNGDLTAHARIRNAALEGFARRGSVATSTREVARAAGVSPGLVQHHFPTKDALRHAVNDHVVVLAETSFGDLPPAGSLTGSLEELGGRVSRFVREEPDALLYVARAAAEGDEDGLRAFDSFVAIAETQWRHLSDAGLLDAEVDLTWAALQVTVINLGSVLFAQAVSRHLPEPFAAGEQVERWKAANTALFERGLSRSGARVGDGSST